MEKNARGDQEPLIFCWNTPPTWVSEASTARESGADGTGCPSLGTEARRSLAEMKENSISSVHRKDLGSPLRAEVRGARIPAASFMNRL